MTLANKITFTRIFLTPLFAVVLLKTDLPWQPYLAAGTFVFLALSDAIDGIIARKRNEVSDLGKFLDPLADKLLVTTALVGLVGLGRLSPVPVIIILAREFAVMGKRVQAAAEGNILPASYLSKWKTVAQILAILILILNWPYAQFGIWIAVILSLVSGVEYFIKGR